MHIGASSAQRSKRRSQELGATFKHLRALSRPIQDASVLVFNYKLGCKVDIDLCDWTTVPKNRLSMWLEVYLCGCLNIVEPRVKTLESGCRSGIKPLLMLVCPLFSMLHFLLLMPWDSHARWVYCIHILFLVCNTYTCTKFTLIILMHIFKCLAHTCGCSLG